MTIRTAPRLVVAAATSSAGKTTIATGLMAALRSRGHEVAGFKVGPDYIDPGYHALATGRPGRNLDAVLTSEELIPRLFLRGTITPTPATVSVIEGVMGLYDGQLGRDGFGSTAHVAHLIDAPVVLVIDAAGSSRTAAATALGLRSFDPSLRVAGVILNRVASTRHADEMTAALQRADLAVFGVVPRSPAIHAPSRHLGLVPAAERAESRATIDALARHIAAHVDLDALVAVAASAPPLTVDPWDPADAVRPVAGHPKIAVLGGRAFTFRYPETTELLVATGCEVAELDPLEDTDLPPDVAGLYIGGGFPEMHAVELSRNAPLRRAIGNAIASGVPTVAECAGLLYLADHLDGHPMVGALPADALMTPRLSLGYRTATAPRETLVAPAGAELTGHEFHRTRTMPSHGEDPAWTWRGASEGYSLDPSGVGRPTVHASYLHLHWAGFPTAAQRFADAAAHHAATRPLPAPSPRFDALADGIDLAHHGDADTAPGLIDLAVNVMLPAPPDWLADQIAATIARLGDYPDASAARRALAALHRVPPDMVLPTAGAAEAFTLIARALDRAHPVVVHPQFTEPEAALRAAGHQPQRWLLPVDPSDTPSLGDLPDWADAVFVGNPTNPTGRLHPAAELLRAGEGRLLVVDEAFMDAAGEAESLIGPSMPDRLVVRSLSKTWGLAGLRVGYVVGDPELIARLARIQPSWPVSAPAVTAMMATASPEAQAEVARRYANLDAHRTHLVAGLTRAGFPSLPSSAPFVLVDTSACGADSVRAALAAAGFAVRRGESFPGLGPTWIRVKVPTPDVADAFVSALARLSSHG